MGLQIHTYTNRRQPIYGAYSGLGDSVRTYHQFWCQKRMLILHWRRDSAYVTFLKGHFLSKHWHLTLKIAILWTLSTFRDNRTYFQSQHTNYFEELLTFNILFRKLSYIIRDMTHVIIKLYLESHLFSNNAKMNRFTTKCHVCRKNLHPLLKSVCHHQATLII